jgi:cytochrome c556
LLGFGALVFASGAHADEVAQRKAAMQSNGNATNTLAAIFKGETTFDGKAVTFADYSIANNFTAAATLFPEGSMGDDSRAKPEIWQDMTGFVAALEKTDAAAKAVAAAGEADDEAAFKGAFGELGGACKDCHDNFRAPKKS